jgi:hypothetical protein
VVSGLAWTSSVTTREPVRTSRNTEDWFRRIRAEVVSQDTRMPDVPHPEWQLRRSRWELPNPDRRRALGLKRGADTFRTQANGPRTPCDKPLLSSRMYDGVQRPYGGSRCQQAPCGGVGNTCMTPTEDAGPGGSRT